MIDPASDPGSAAVAAGPDDQAAKIAELEAQVKKQAEFLEKARGENIALGEARQKLSELEARLEAAQTPSTQPDPQQPSQAEQAYYRDLLAAAMRGEGWAIAEVNRLQREENMRAETQWKLDLAAIPEALRDEVDREARTRRIPLQTAREIVELRKKTERAQSLEAENEELRKDRQAGSDKADLAPGAQVVGGAAVNGAMPMSEWQQKKSAAKAKWDESKHTDRAAYDELARLASIRDRGLIVMNR